MTIEEAIQKLRQLSPEKQQQVLAVVESLERPQAEPQRRNVAGLFAHLGIDLSPEEIDANREEMFASFPQDDF